MDIGSKFKVYSTENQLNVNEEQFSFVSGILLLNKGIISEIPLKFSEFAKIPLNPNFAYHSTLTPKSATPSQSSLTVPNHPNQEHLCPDPTP
jgi:hypothetical protein